jgi:hypothetical protein
MLSNQWGCEVSKPKSFKECAFSPIEQLKWAYLSPQLQMQSFDDIISELREGIPAVKFHYSNKKTKECRIKLSDDLRTLYWVYDDSRYSSALMRRFCEVKDILSVLYGPNTYTFRSYKL